MTPEYFQRLAMIESSDNPNARSNTSSATGRYQMTKGTYADLQKSNPWLSYGSWDEHARDPQLQEAAARALTKSNTEKLRAKGYEDNDLNRYLAHFAGIGGADKLLRSNVDARVGDILGAQVAKANPQIANMTVAQMKAHFGAKLGQPQQVASVKPWERYAEGGQVSDAKPWEKEWAPAPAPVAQQAPASQQAPDVPKKVKESPKPVKPSSMAGTPSWMLSSSPAEEGANVSDPSNPFAYISEDQKTEQGAAGKAISKVVQNTMRTGAGLAQGAVIDPMRAVAQFIPGANQWAADSEKEYEKFRKGMGGEGFDASRLVGSVVSPVGIKGAQAISKAIPMTGNLGRGITQGVAQGALGSALQPLEGVNADTSLTDLLGKKTMQVGTGAALGGVLGGAFGKFGANTAKTEGHLPIENISRSEAVRRYKNELGEEAAKALTPYQRMGMTSLEQKATSVPGSGYVAEQALRKAETAQQRGMLDIALDPIKKKISSDKSGRTAIGEAENILKKEYDEILPNMKVPGPNQLRQQIFEATADDFKKMSPAQQEKFTQRLNSGLFDNYRVNGNSRTMTGDQWKVHWSTAKDDYKRLTSPTASADDAMVGNALKKAWEVSRNSLQPKSGAPDDIVQRLKNTDHAYYGYKILKKASEASGAAGGKFTPTQVINAIKQYEGQIPLGDKNKLLNAAELSNKVFGPKYGDSGTAGREAVSKWLGGGGAITGLSNPGILIPSAAIYGGTNLAFLTPYAINALNQKIAPRLSDPIRQAIDRAGSKAGQVVQPAVVTRALKSPNSRDYEEEEAPPQYARGGRVGGLP